VTITLTALVVGAGEARAQTPWYEGFEGPETSWHEAGGDAQFQVVLHRRVRGEAFTGEGCEHVAVSGTGGTYVYLSHDVGRPRVIDELLPTVRIKSDRAGMQILARIVLPRTEDPRTGRPIATFVRGSSYTAVGRWQQLRIDDVPTRLARQTRILRAELGPHVDPREAYVDSVLLNVYGGPGVTNVWIDDLDVGGHVEAPSGMAKGSSGDPRPVSPGPDSLPDRGQSTSGRTVDVGSSRPRRIVLQGSVLLVDGRPMFPRIIRYQGEPLGLLARLGFNAVWLSEPPSTEVLDEVARLDLWVVCPPPHAPQATETDSPPAPPIPIGPRYERVLAWDLGRGLTAAELDATRRLARHVQTADRQEARPLICGPDSELRKYSQCADVLLIGRSPLASSLELTEYGTWLRERPRLARLGTPVWTTVQTQPAPSVRRQWSALGLAEALPAAASPEQIRLLTYTAVTAGVRGLLFESDSPLDAPDADTRTRALALELLNLELALIEPWLQAGRYVTTVQASEPEVIVPVLWTDRARLAVPIWSGPGAQFVPGQSAGNGVSFVVRGAPESSNAYLLTPGVVEPIRHKRVTTGTRVTLDEFGPASLVVLTGEPLVLGSLRQRADAVARRAAQLQRQLAAGKCQAVEQVLGQLSSRTVAHPQSASWLRSARQGIQWSDASLAAQDYPAAYRYAQRAMRPLRLLERAYWQTAVESLPSSVSSPAAVSFATLPSHVTLMEQVRSRQPGPNLLPAGGFEDLRAMLQAGWKHFQHPLAGIRPEADLASTAAHSGGYGLRLAARMAADDNQELLVESPPSWITSPTVPVEAGDLVCVHGWVQVPSPITGSVDGLLIVDSLSGEPLAERIGQTAGWQEFTLYRIAAERGGISVTFALSGLGEAWLDDVTIHRIPIRRAGAAPLDVSGLPAAPPYGSNGVARHRP